MNALLFDHSHHLDTSFSAVENEIGLLITRGNPWRLSFALGLHSLSILVTLDVLRKALRKIPSHEVIDPDDQLCDKVLEYQQRLNRMYHKMPRSLWFNRRLIRRVHHKTSLIRTWVLEHDVDAAPTPVTGSFTNPEDLVKHLESL